MFNWEENVGQDVFFSVSYNTQTTPLQQKNYTLKQFSISFSFFFF